MAPHHTLPSNLLETLHVSANLQTLAPSADWKPNLALLFLPKQNLTTGNKLIGMERLRTLLKIDNEGD